MKSSDVIARWKLLILSFMVYAIFTASSCVDAKTSSPQTKEEFRALVAITDDPGWASKLEKTTAVDGLPVVNVATKARVGSKVWVLVFFSNPHRDKGGQIRTTLHLKITQADGKLALDEPGIACFAGPISPETQSIRACGTTYQIGFDSTDPVGLWEIIATVKDENTGLEATSSSKISVLPSS